MKFLSCVFFLINLVSSIFSFPADEIRYYRKDVGNNIFLDIIEIDLKKEVSIFSVLPAGGIGFAEEFSILLEEVSADAAINGCYFCTKTNILVSSIAVFGNEITTGTFKPTFVVDYENNPDILDGSEISIDKKKYRVAISCVDVLVKNKIQKIKSYEDMILAGHNPSPDNHVFKPNPQSAIGIDKGNKIVYFISTANKIRLYEFGKYILENVKVKDVLGLDGGLSVGLYFKGEYKIRPKRKLPAIIVAKKMKLKK